MKAFPLRLIVISISLSCILSIGLVSALEQGELSIVPSWSKSTPYQGDNTAVTLRLTSTSSELLRIYRVGLHFDWMPEGSFYTLDLSDDPVAVPASGINIFDPMVIQIPTNVSAGSHSYFIGIDGVEDYDSFSWNSPDFTLQILEYRSKIYDSLLTQVDDNISRAVNAAYKSAEAQSLLEQAQNERAEATTFATDENWGEATLTLQQAFTHLEQAEAAEQLYAEQQAGQQTLLLIVAVIVVIVVIVAIAVVVRKRRKQQPQPIVDQPVEQSPETQDSTPD